MRRISLLFLIIFPPFFALIFFSFFILFLIYSEILPIHSVLEILQTERKKRREKDENLNYSCFLD